MTFWVYSFQGLDTITQIENSTIPIEVGVSILLNKERYRYQYQVQGLGKEPAGLGTYLPT